MRRFSAAAIVLVLLLPACAARSSPMLREAIEHPTARELLRRELRSLFNAPSVSHAQWGVNFYSLRSAETLYSLNAAQFMVPASNQKLLTAAVAAERLGWDYRFTTRVFATGPLDDAGTISGDVVIVGNGDPTINPRHPERWRAFDDWGAALRARGVKIINGSLIGDDNAFAEPAWGTGWAWDNLQYGYGAPPSALQFNENQVEVLVGPGMSAGSRAIISTSPLGSGLIVDHDVTTSVAGEPSRVDIARVPGTAFLTVRGQIAADAKPVTITASVENPTRFYLTALREALARHGIFVAGGVTDVDELGAPPSLDGAIELFVDTSPPLIEIIDVAMKWSRNIYAETLLLAAAEPGEPATGARGLEQLRATLRTWGILPEYYLPRDGSGLSRYDYVSADALTWLLTYLWADPKHAERFRSTLPVAGVSGTLANRMKGTPAQGRVWAKTGTLSNVRTLSGYVTTFGGETIVFAMMANNFRVPAADIDAIMDRALGHVALLPR
ncbi:MAG TPA: D-alanyl-D-alanine carboxypeptidase/D-alanyl-D-alanine-endopeptidase [Vicinamibacterales bacterium]|nr:D-alanyl-D-alanine carboxypeptidase/D-alanyl-D-alanine-endopeptidase [Vicinamibacterales bacterium]